MRAYETLTMTAQEDASIVYRYDLHTRKENFQNSRENYFKLISVNGKRAVFSSMKDGERHWRLVIEITQEGHLKGAQFDSTGEDSKVYVGYDASPMDQ